MVLRAGYRQRFEGITRDVFESITLTSTTNMSTINDMITWQAKARPEPTARQFDVAVGVHIEEFVEMLDSLESKVWAWSTTRESLHNISKALKAGGATCQIKDRVALLDALCDQVRPTVVVDRDDLRRRLGETFKGGVLRWRSNALSVPGTDLRFFLCHRLAGGAERGTLPARVRRRRARRRFCPPRW